MKVVVVPLVALTLVACSPDTLPTSPITTPALPSPPLTDTGWIWAMAADKSGRCIEGATFEVVRGQGPIGAVISQRTPCSVWDYDGGVELRDLTLTVAMTLRASARGYATVERNVFPKTRGVVEEFILEKLR
jgi:hypothetical protein